MRPGRFVNGMLAGITVLALSCALAAGAPEAVAARLTAGGGDLIVTDARGVIVGVGRVVAGASFELRVLEGFVGPARLTLLRADGTAEALDVVIGDRVMVEGFDLLELLEARVEAFTVEVNGVAVSRAERAGAGAGAGGDETQGEDRGPDAPPGPADAPGPPGSPGGGPNPPGPRGPEGRP